MTYLFNTSKSKCQCQTTSIIEVNVKRQYETSMSTVNEKTSMSNINVINKRQ